MQTEPEYMSEAAKGETDMSLSGAKNMYLREDLTAGTADAAGM